MLPTEGQFLWSTTQKLANKRAKYLRNAARGLISLMMGFSV